jgi:hypothetical protein
LQQLGAMHRADPIEHHELRLRCAKIGERRRPLARALEREDLVALTVEAAAMANVPLAGTSWVPGK